MTCPHCEAIQCWGIDRHGIGPVYYVRVGTHNVAIVACQEAASRVIHALRLVGNAPESGG